jgi:hypothetical protein
MAEQPPVPTPETSPDVWAEMANTHEQGVLNGERTAEDERIVAEREAEDRRLRAERAAADARRATEREAADTKRVEDRHETLESRRRSEEVQAMNDEAAARMQARYQDLRNQGGKSQAQRNAEAKAYQKDTDNLINEDDLEPVQAELILTLRDERAQVDSRRHKATFARNAERMGPDATQGEIEASTQEDLQTFHENNGEYEGLDKFILRERGVYTHDEYDAFRQTEEFTQLVRSYRDDLRAQRAEAAAAQSRAEVEAAHEQRQANHGGDHESDNNDRLEDDPSDNNPDDDVVDAELVEDDADDADGGDPGSEPEPWAGHPEESGDEDGSDDDHEGDVDGEPGDGHEEDRREPTAAERILNAQRVIEAYYDRVNVPNDEVRQRIRELAEHVTQGSNGQAAHYFVDGEPLVVPAYEEYIDEREYLDGDSNVTGTPVLVRKPVEGTGDLAQGDALVEKLLAINDPEFWRVDRRPVDGRRQVPGDPKVMYLEDYEWAVNSILGARTTNPNVRNDYERFVTRVHGSAALSNKDQSAFYKEYRDYAQARLDLQREREVWTGETRPAPYVPERDDSRRRTVRLGRRAVRYARTLGGRRPS